MSLRNFGLAEPAADSRPRADRSSKASVNGALCVFLALTLSACSSQPGDRTAATANTEDIARAESSTTTIEDAPTPEKPIPADSVYPLLVAEFALRRRDFETALGIYLQQAELLQDPAVSAHATHLAQYLRREREAFRAVRLWVELEPGNLEANGTLASLLARQGRNREALPHLLRVARGGESAKFPVLLSRFKSLAPQEQRGLDADVQALLNDELSDNVSLLLTHALMAEESGQPDLVEQRLVPVFALEPYQEQALILEAKLRLAQNAETPLARIEEALAKDPARSQLRLQYARLLAAKDMPAAREQFEILSAEAPQNADLLFSLALLNHELKDNVTAKAYLRRVLELGKRSDEAYFLLGQITAAEGDREEAIQLFQQVGDGQDLIKATMNIARLQLGAGRDQEFRDYMNRLRESYPPRREQLFALEANIYGEMGRDEQSLAVLDRAIGEFPASTNLLYARSVLRERQDDIPGAEADLRQIIERDPENSTALNALGYTLANRTQRFDEAQALIEEALRLSPNEPAILDSMGWVLYRQGELEQAIQFLSRAYAGFPDPEVAAHLGEVLWANGDSNNAMNIWRSAMNKDPQHTVLNETLNRLGITLRAETENAVKVDIES